MKMVLLQHLNNFHAHSENYLPTYLLYHVTKGWQMSNDIASYLSFTWYYQWKFIYTVPIQLLKNIRFGFLVTAITVFGLKIGIRWNPYALNLVFFSDSSDTEGPDFSTTANDNYVTRWCYQLNWQVYVRVSSQSRTRT